MSTIPAALSADGNTAVDVPTGSQALLTLPPEAAGQAVTWQKNGAAFQPPADLTVGPRVGADDVYTASANGSTWSVVVRWQPDAPKQVVIKAGRGSATVSWSPSDGEREATYYEVMLNPAPAAAQLPRRVMRGARALPTQRKLLIDGLRADVYDATVCLTRVGDHGRVSSPATPSDKGDEVLARGPAYPVWVRVGVFALSLAAAVVTFVLLVHDPRAGKKISLDTWALWAGALWALAILLFVLGLVRVRDLLSGADSRISTTRVNVAIWTVVVAFGIGTLTAFAFGAHRYHMANPCGRKLVPGKPDPKKVNGICVDGRPVAATALDFGHLFKDGLTPNYLVLLGAPFVTLAGAAFIVNRQIGTGSRQKVPADGPARYTDALTNDDGSADLVDSQYLVFTGVLLFYFLTSFLPSPSTLPDLPWGLVGLTGVSAGTFLLNKSVTTNGLSITGLSAPSAPRGGPDRVLGNNFLPDGSAEMPEGGVTVVVGDTPATVTTVTNSEIAFTVPATLPPQTYNVQVTTAAGVTASAGPLTVT